MVHAVRVTASDPLATFEDTKKKLMESFNPAKASVRIRAVRKAGPNSVVIETDSAEDAGVILKNQEIKKAGPET